MYTIFQTSNFMLTLLALYILRYYILLFALFTHSVLFSLNSFLLNSFDVKGKAKCILCTKVITWWTWFSITLWSHENREPCSYCCTKIRKLPSSWYLQSSSWAWWYVRAPPVYLDQATGSSSSKPPPQSAVHILDRKANMEAMLVSFLAEQNLLFTLAGK